MGPCHWKQVREEDVHCEVQPLHLGTEHLIQGGAGSKAEEVCQQEGGFEGDAYISFRRGRRTLWCADYHQEDQDSRLLMAHPSQGCEEVHKELWAVPALRQAISKGSLGPY